MLVLVLLSTIAYLSGCKPTDWLGAAAVFITFLHGQLSFDMQESQDKMPVATVQNYHWSSPTVRHQRNSLDCYVYDDRLLAPLRWQPHFRHLPPLESLAPPEIKDFARNDKSRQK
jgi:hypothetical protein